MSASSKKKLRKEQNVEQLSKKQLQQKAEAKKLKLYTGVFVTILSLVIAIAAGVLGYRAIDKSGIIQKNTIAATIGDHKINSVEMSYFYVDAINNTYNQWYSQYSQYTSTPDSYIKMLYNLDTNLPLNEQIQNAETGETWADYFIAVALEDAKATYALYDKATAANYTLSEEYQSELDSTLKLNDDMSVIYGFANVDEYLVARYGNGSSQESFNEYITRTMVAYAYSRDIAAAMEFTDEEISNYDKEHYVDFNSYSYASYTLTYSSFLEGGTTGEDGKVTYSDAEKDAARAKLKEVAESLTTAANVEELDKMIAALEINKNSSTPAKSTHNERSMIANVTTEQIANWLKADGRKAGDIAAVPRTNTTTNADGSTTTTTDIYYILLVEEIDENKDLMSNVRHLLVKFEGGTKDSAGNTTYSDAEKKVAEDEARKHLQTWLDGEATEESFIELVKQYTDDNSKETGGLYSNIHKDSSYVENFLKWAVNPEHTEGYADVIETEYGFHVMYHCGNSDVTYRNYMITEELRTAKYEEWYNDAIKDVTVVNGNFSKLNLDHVIANNT